jgi:membrane protease YdiL (CAAX protease family)
MHRAALEPLLLLRAGAIGILAIGIPSLLLLGIGELRVEPTGTTSSMAWTNVWQVLAVLVPAALWEELATRGYLLSVLRERFGVRSALLSTSVVFGLLHLQNAGATALSTAAVVLAGIFLGLVRLSTGSLYAAWAAHLAWNLTMSFALRTPVSGIDLGVGGYHVVDAGPDWLTGGAWGPEGGIGAMLGMTVACWYLLRRQRREEFKR